jgi:hypothetical protein
MIAHKDRIQLDYRDLARASDMWARALPSLVWIWDLSSCSVSVARGVASVVGEIYPLPHAGEGAASKHRASISTSWARGVDRIQTLGGQITKF